jgi:hypothetical protein
MAHRSAALRGAATAGTGTPEAVIKGKLFSCPDFPETIEEDVSADPPYRQIRIATMINELGAASSDCAIKHRGPIQVNRVNPPCFPRPEHPYGTAHGFPLADSLAGILDDPLAQRNRFFREHAEPFDVRPANDDLKTDELRVETRNVMLRGYINGAE